MILIGRFGNALVCAVVDTATSIKEQATASAVNARATWNCDESIAVSLTIALRAVVGHHHTDFPRALRPAVDFSII